MSERDEKTGERGGGGNPGEESQGASQKDAEEQAGTPGDEGQDDDGQSSGNPKNAG
jgi:hypothetical protein